MSPRNLRDGQCRNPMAHLLETLLPPANSAGRTSHAVEILALRSLALQALDDTDGALDSLEQAIRLGEPRGFVRVFVDKGEPMMALLQQTALRGIAPRYVRHLVSAFDESQTIRSHAQPLPEPLTERLGLQNCRASNIIEL